MKQLPTIKQEFDSLVAAAFRVAPVGSVQRQEMERMFFAGYRTAMDSQIFVSGFMTDDEMLAWMERQKQELYDYFKLLGKIPGTTEVQ